VVGNPRAEVEVRVAPDGMIQSRRIVQSSGNKAWDDAVLRAIEKTAVLPKDTDGRVPQVIVMGFRPLDCPSRTRNLSKLADGLNICLEMPIQQHQG
jgi:colicin import membrane protein